MSGETFVVQTIAGTWAMSCCDDIHGLYEQPHEEFSSKTAAERAATAHRVECRRERKEWEDRIARCCPTCGRVR